jgi:hypothetical protein
MSRRSLTCENEIPQSSDPSACDAIVCGASAAIICTFCGKALCHACGCDGDCFDSPTRKHEAEMEADQYRPEPNVCLQWSTPKNLDFGLAMCIAIESITGGAK